MNWPTTQMCINCERDMPHADLDFDMAEDPDDPSHQWSVAQCIDEQACLAESQDNESQDNETGVNNG